MSNQSNRQILRCALFRGTYPSVFATYRQHSHMWEGVFMGLSFNYAHNLGLTLAATIALALNRLCMGNEFGRPLATCVD